MRVGRWVHTLKDVTTRKPLTEASKFRVTSRATGSGFTDMAFLPHSPGIMLFLHATEILVFHAPTHRVVGTIIVPQRTSARRPSGTDTGGVFSLGGASSSDAQRISDFAQLLPCPHTPDTLIVLHADGRTVSVWHTSWFEPQCDPALFTLQAVQAYTPPSSIVYHLWDVVAVFDGGSDGVLVGPHLLVDPLLDTNFVGCDATTGDVVCWSLISSATTGVRGRGIKPGGDDSLFQEVTTPRIGRSLSRSSLMNTAVGDTEDLPALRLAASALLPMLPGRATCADVCSCCGRWLVIGTTTGHVQVRVCRGVCVAGERLTWCPWRRVQVYDTPSQVLLRRFRVTSVGAITSVQFVGAPHCSVLCTMSLPVRSHGPHVPWGLGATSRGCWLAERTGVATYIVDVHHSCRRHGCDPAHFAHVAPASYPSVLAATRRRCHGRRHACSCHRPDERVGG